MKTIQLSVMAICALSVCTMAVAGAGDITINIQDLTGSPIAPDTNVNAKLWGYSQSTTDWYALPKSAVSDGSGGSTVTWTASEIDTAVDVSANDFHYVISVWGGDDAANGQIESPTGLWGQFIPYDASTPEVNWDVRTYREPVYPATQTATGLKYDVDLSGLSPTYTWPDIYVSYAGCEADSQPVLEAAEITAMGAEGYTFDETQVDSDGLIRIMNSGTGYDEWIAARSDGQDGYILELEWIGEGSLSYDDVAKELYVDIDYAALGLSDGDRFFSMPSYGIDGPGTYTSGGTDYETIDWLIPGAVASVLDVQYVPEPASMGLLAIGGLGVLLRRRR